MRVLVTGHRGYLGSVLTPLLYAAGHDVVGCDIRLFAGCELGPPTAEIADIGRDVRSISAEDLRGFDAVCHLAGISNDPVGDLDAAVTHEVNGLAAAHLGRCARDAGVGRFIFASTCSVYGATAGDLLDETAVPNPVTPYAEAKLWAEESLRELTDDSFVTTYLRPGTAYGFSPMLRADLVVNNLVGHAVLDGAVLLKSDGSPWRPLVHIEDIARAFVAVLSAPADAVNDQALNVGRSDENYRVRDVAEMVVDAVPGSELQFAADAGPDTRHYRVNCDELAARVPDFRPVWRVEDGIGQLRDAYRAFGLTHEGFDGRLMRIRHLLHRQATGEVTSDMRVVTLGATAWSA